MGQTVNMGGDRLGSGSKMNVELRAYERTTFDIGYLWRSTMSAGTLVPFMCEIATPGTTFDIRLNCDVKTHPTIGPLFGSYKVQLDVFTAPIRLYQGSLHNNKLKIGMNMSSVKLPLIELPVSVMLGDIPDIPDIDNASINPSCLLAYLGIRGTGINVPEHTAVPAEFNAIPLLAYWDIYKNYYANKQEEEGAVIHTNRPGLVEQVVQIDVYPIGMAASPGPQPLSEQSTPGAPASLGENGQIDILYLSLPQNLNYVMVNLSDGRRLSIEELRTGAVDGTTPNHQIITYDFAKWGPIVLESWQYIRTWELNVVEPEVVRFPLENLDVMREELLKAAGSSAAYVINDADLEPYNYLYSGTSGYNNMLNNQEGLALKTYQSDMLNNWLAQEWIDGLNGISAITAISTTGDQFTVDQLNLAKKVYDLLNRVIVSGGSYDDWLDAVWTHERFKRTETPMYEGGLIKELVFQEVVSNSASTDGTAQPLGTLAGKGVMAQKHKGGTVRIKIDEPSYVMGIISITPRLDYSQGNKWDIYLKTMDDLHKPALDGIGFQDLLTRQAAWWSETRQVGGGTDFLQRSAGKQTAWINYQTNLNQTRGNFAIDGNEMFMTLNRRYEVNETTSEITDMTTYIDPKKWNNIFAQTSRDAQNFWVQISVDCDVRRKMSGKQIPNL